MSNQASDTANAGTNANLSSPDPEATPSSAFQQNNTGLQASSAQAVPLTSEPCGTFPVPLRTSWLQWLSGLRRPINIPLFCLLGYSAWIYATHLTDKTSGDSNAFLLVVASVLSTAFLVRTIDRSRTRIVLSDSGIRLLPGRLGQAIPPLATLLLLLAQRLCHFTGPLQSSLNMLACVFVIWSMIQLVLLTPGAIKWAMEAGKKRTLWIAAGLAVSIIVIIVVSIIIYSIGIENIPHTVTVMLGMTFCCATLITEFTASLLAFLGLRWLVVRLTGKITKIRQPSSHSWDDLIGVRHERLSPGFIARLLKRKPEDVLCLHFPNCTQEISLSRSSPAQQQMLFTCISRYVDSAALSPEALFLQHEWLTGTQSISVDNMTDLWLKDYQSKFELTNYQPLVPGTRVGGRFVVVLPLCVKSSAATYLASDDSGKKKVVLKEIVVSSDLDDAVQQKLLQQFDRQAAILSRLDHGQIVKVRDHFIESGRSYIVMDFLAGTNLVQLVSARGKLGQALVIEIALQLAELIAYLHGQSPPVVHRDVTPDNILWDDNEHKLYLVDFGAANVFAGKGTGTLIGKQSYMPPEQFRGKAEPASDVYAFGATLSFLLTGKRPLPLSGLVDGAEENLSPEMKLLLSDLGQLEPERRPSWAEIIHRLQSASEGGGGGQR